MAIDRNKIQKQAENYVASGKMDRAIDEFLKLLEDKPNDLMMMNRIGDLYLQSARTREAIDMFKRAGMGYEHDGFIPKAAAVFKKAHRAAPDDADVATRLADLYRQTNLTKEAIQIHIEMAEQFTKKGLLKRALEEFAKVVELDPKNLKNKVKLADLYNKEGMKDRAASIYLEVAEALAIEQMHSEANQLLERAKTMVTTPAVYLTQSRLCVIQKDLGGAAIHLREGLVPNPRSTELLEALAEVEIQSKSPDKALEALGQIPQMPEKAMVLCERALKEMVKAGNTERGLELFKPLGREFARRGMGEVASKVLRNAMHGFFTAETWLQLAEIAHQSGNKQERIDALRHAYVEVKAKGDDDLTAAILEQLRSMGVTDDEMAAPQAMTSHPTIEQTPFPSLETTEVDPIRRMQIQQLQRDADNFVRARYGDKAQEAYNKILELDPTNREAIYHIADLVKATGKMTSVQMHYVKNAERVANLGFRELALELLDKAEAIFPGSTRLYRRTLGLLDTQPAAHPTAPPAATPVAPPAEISIPLEATPRAPVAPPVESFSNDLDMLIALDEDRKGPSAPEPMAPEPIAAGPGPAPTPVIPPPPVEALDALENQDLTFELPQEFENYPAPTDSMELNAMDLALADAEEATEPFVHIPAPMAPIPEASIPEIPTTEAPELEPLELEPLPFVPKPPLAAGPVEPMAEYEVDEDLASLLSDIDFQMDYGSPEEAKLEIANALQAYPNHPELLSRLELAEEALKRIGRESRAARESSEDAHSFFDLTDVLGDALLESGEGEEMHDATNVVEKIQSVDELFNAFREGVEQQVKTDDFDTHYNLGIAYKEMLLLEPAMEEFKKAMRDPERTLECCSMLSICELAQGHLEPAAQWLRQGIEAPGFPPEDSVGLH